MRVSLKWLREYVAVDMPTTELMLRLKLAGIGVEQVEHTGGSFQGVYVGEIVALERHPNADRLQLATVRYRGEPATVVTGAPNLSVRDRVPFAVVGAELVDFHSDPPRRQSLRPTKIRGIDSAGMVCSAAELGLGDDHAGILILDPTAPVGAELADILGDTILELEITPNRGDCLSMLGFAQEVGAIAQRPFAEPKVEVVAKGQPTSERVKVEIQDPSLCRRYVAGIVEGVTVGPSPAWLRERLIAGGIRPISNVVDVTNYVMLEYGQPLHAFDFDTIAGRRIVVRRARPGERLVTLDSVDRALSQSMQVIADAERAVALAGVMGGLDTEVTDRTKTVLLEAATFEPIITRRTARGLKVPSEASRRFEKGLPPELAEKAMERAAQLVREVCGGEIGSGWTDCYPAPSTPPRITVAYAEFERLLGIRIEPGEVRTVLERLGFGVESNADAVAVAPPYRRVDVAIPADVVEEVARVIGYDRLPATRLRGEAPAPNPPDAPHRLEGRVRDALLACGASEVIAYSLTSAAALDRLPTGQTGDRLADEAAERFIPDVEPLRLVNPLSSEMALMRTSAWGSILGLLRDNLRWLDRDVLLFEIGRIYVPRAGDLPEERQVATLAMGGFRSGGRMHERVPTSFYDLKGVLEAALGRLGVDGVTFAATTHPMFRAGHCAAILRGDRRNRDAQLLGIVGEVASAARRSHDLDEPALLASLDLGRVYPLMTAARPITGLARYPAVYQDLALALADDLPAEDVRRAILRAGRPIARDAAIFDVFTSEQVGTGRRSLAYRVTYQSDERTLTDAEVAGAHNRIEDALRKQFGAEIRGR